MPKLGSKPIGLKDLVDYINSESDFGFELETLKLMRSLGMECEHGGHYEDPVTKKSREFDIRSKLDVGRCRVRLAVECKNIKENFPILISQVPRRDDEAYHQIGFIGKPAQQTAYFNAIQSVSGVRRINVKDGNSIYEPNTPVGKSTVQVGRLPDSSLSANDSELFEKWGQCLSSLDGLIRDMEWDAEQDSYRLVIAIPMVVVPDGRLWSVEYNADGVIQGDPHLSDRCSCYVDKKYLVGSEPGQVAYWVSHLEILTHTGLKDFCASYLAGSANIERLFPPQVIASTIA